MSCVADLALENGLQILQSLSNTRWSARCVNLRIVHRCMRAVINFLQQQKDPDSCGLLAVMMTSEFQFGVAFLKQLFILINATSTALQAGDIDLAAAAIAVRNLKACVSDMRSEEQFNAIYQSVEQFCTLLGIDSRPQKRMRRLPLSLQGSVMNSFVTKSSDAFIASNAESGDLAKHALRVDFFFQYWIL